MSVAALTSVAAVLPSPTERPAIRPRVDVIPIAAPPCTEADAAGAEVAASALVVGGVTPFSATDFPGRLSAVLFVQGCPWRCGYCHNPHLQPRQHEGSHAWEPLWAWLHKRRGLLDAVVFSGGEPTLDPALAEAMRAVRTLGFEIGLHTAGIYPRRLAEVLPLVDWVGFDLKSDTEGYDALTGVAHSAAHVMDSLGQVLASGVPCEVRTTVHPQLHPPARLLGLARQLQGLGVRDWMLQTFRAQGCADASLAATADPGYPGEALRRDIEAFGLAVSLRQEG